MPRSFKDYIAEANAQVKTYDVDAAARLLDDDDTVFVDVRDGDEVARGRIPGAHHASRGLLEFKVDPGSPMHDPVFSSGKHIVFYCGTGGRSALAAKVAMDMGLSNVAHMAGGIKAWVMADREIDESS